MPEEIAQAVAECNQAKAALDNADADFVESAVHYYEAARLRLDALIKRAKGGE